MEANFFKKWLVPVLTIFAATYGLTWNFAEPLGLETGSGLLASIIAIALAVTILYVLSYRLYEYSETVKQKDKEIDTFRDQLEDALKNQSHCCVKEQMTKSCPLGVLSIENRMKNTLVTSILEAKRSFRWYGLSAFNVVHNNKELFAQRRDIKFEFVIANPTNKRLADRNDQWYGDTTGRLNSHELIKNANSLIKDIRDNLNSNINIRYHNQLPTFRLIIVDDKKAYVSFYEKGKDALESVQLIIDCDTEQSIYDWFEGWYLKSLITEEIIIPKPVIESE